VPLFALGVVLAGLAGPARAAAPTSSSSPSSSPSPASEAAGQAMLAPPAATPASVLSPPPAPTPVLPHADLEQLYTQGRFDEGLKRARAQLDANPNDVDLYWHVARFMYEIGERVHKDSADYDKEAWYAEMLAVCERGLTLSPGHPHLLFGKGIALARLGTTRGIVASIRYADDIEGAWMSSAHSDSRYRSLGGEEILPCDPMMGLGTFYRMVPDMWIVKVLTGTRGDLDKALDYLNRADRCSPGRIEIRKELGVAQVCYGQRRHQDQMVVQGIQTLREAAAMAPTKPTDVTDVRDAAMVADDPSMACAYSRDGQAEVDAKALESQGVRATP